MNYDAFVRSDCWMRNKFAACTNTGVLVPITIYGGNVVWVHESCKEAAEERNTNLVENLRHRRELRLDE